MRNDDYCLLAFNSTHDAVSAEKLLSAHFNVTLMPTLRKITASCGISLRVELADFDKLRGLILDNNVICSLYMVSKGEPKQIFLQ